MKSCQRSWLYNNIGVYLRDITVFTIFAILGAYSLQVIIPIPTVTETPIANLVWIIVQLTLATIYVNVTRRAYDSLMGYNLSDYSIFTTYTTVFFLLQGQVFTRFLSFFKNTAGIDIKSIYYGGLPATVKQAKKGGQVNNNQVGTGEAGNAQGNTRT